MGRTDWSEEEVEEMVRLYKSGRSFRAIGVAFDGSRETIRQRLRLSGVAPRPRYAPRLTKSQEAMLAERYERGETAVSLAEEFGVSKTTVGKYLRSAGVQLRNPGNRNGLSGEQARDRVIALRKEGKTVRQIARELGVSSSTQAELAKELGWERRTKRHKLTAEQKRNEAKLELRRLKKELDQLKGKTR